MRRGAYQAVWVSAGWLVILFTLTPILVIFFGSFTTKEYLSLPLDGLSLRWYWEILDQPKFLDGFARSVQLGVGAALLSTFLGTLAAIGMFRRNPKATGWVAIILMLPLMVPSVIIAMSVLQFFNTLNITSPYATLLLGHTVITFPYVVRSVTATLGLMPRGIEWAGANLGANPLRVIWHVTVPNIRPGVVGGLIISFLVSFDSVTISLFLQTPAFVPLPVRLYNFIEYGVEPVVAALSTLLMLLSAVGIYIAERFVGMDVIFGARK
jgi:putative spermidine/putrescine transport system permease protein